MSCPHIQLDGLGRCLFCGVMVDNLKTTRPPSFNDSVNPFELAKGLEQKNKQKKESQSNSQKKDIFDPKRVIFPKSS